MRPILLCMIFSLLLAACSPATLPITATPTPLPPNTKPTRIPRTPKRTRTPKSTITTTPQVTETLAPTSTKKPTKTPKTPDVKFNGCLTPTGTSNQLAPFKIENLSKKRISVFINGMTKKGEHPIYCSYELSKGDAVVFTLWWGDYTYMVQVKDTTTYDGTFWINNEDKATMRVTVHGIQLGPFP